MQREKAPPNRISKRAGFTLLEIFVVLVIIVALMSAAMVQFSKGQTSAAKQRCRDQMHSIVLALDMYYSEHNRHYPEADEEYASDDECFAAFLNNQRYFPGGRPECPHHTGEGLSYGYVRPEPQAGVLPEPTTVEDPIVICLDDESHGGFPYLPDEEEAE